MDTLLFMMPPLLMAIFIVGMHSYLGIHVLKRGIIFVDLALAQLAALGAIVGLSLGFTPGDTSSYIISFVFILLGSFLFSILRSRDKRIPQEAIIGIIYGLSIAIAMAIADKLSSGGQQIKEMLTGNILWVTWDNILKIAIVYSIITLFHIIFRKKFITLSQDYDNVKNMGFSSKLWDFLFFVSFGIVITLSVPIAGVLLVFSFLMIPAAISALFSSSWNVRIIIGWIVGILACMFGFWYSYSQNAPCGPATVCILAVILLCAMLFSPFIVKKS